MRADGDREALRLLVTGRDNAVQSGKTARTTLASVLVTAPAQLRDQLRHLPAERRARACAQLACPRRPDRLTRIVHQTLIRLGQRAVALTEAADDLEAQIAAIVEDLAPGLVAAEYGLGALTAAQILLSWSHAGRIRTEAAFAMLSGTAPVPVSSGRTGRHRLNRLGDRQLNRALHTMAVSRMRSHPPTRTYAGRRRAEGRTDRSDIISGIDLLIAEGSRTRTGLESAVPAMAGSWPPGRSGRPTGGFAIKRPMAEDHRLDQRAPCPALLTHDSRPRSMAAAANGHTWKPPRLEPAG
jgi:hypothetical protein